MKHNTTIKLYINDNWFEDTNIIIGDGIFTATFECSYKTTGILNSLNPEDDFIIYDVEILDVAVRLTGKTIFYMDRFNKNVFIDHYWEDIKANLIENYIKKQNENSNLYNALAHIYDKDR